MLGLASRRVKVGGCGLLAAFALTACTQAPTEGKTVRIPTFEDTPDVTAPPTTPPTPEWTPTWEASLPTVAPVIKPSGTTPPKPPPATRTPPPTRPPIVTIPTLPGVPFAKEGGRCSPEGAIGITRTGQPLVCTKSGRGESLRWRAP
ncbi:hypothetical protein JOF56_000024 [Kibdelosporangium banguiense]|uniref:Lipoprotein n=1 Tax=Kibdelosporangium banguiense TaxID=1365924 RepID=A0ABS4T595_9PSEU|nr:hypothetical protein [Kibdelosporangium banguiense]MBP2319639.1 hypothetical protein [Kibdelosporangium banguiense]